MRAWGSGGMAAAMPAQLGWLRGARACLAAAMAIAAAMWLLDTLLDPGAFPLLHAPEGVQEGLQTKELAWASAAGMAAMSALCLWRGFKEDE